MLSTGSLLDNRYRLDDRVATGGMGDVWRGTDVVLGRTVAVKVLRTAMLEDPEFATRFYGEARMMAAFRHPGVVEVYDYASDGDYEGPEKVAYLVMAFVEGEPLSNRVKEGPLEVTETMSIVAQAADALHAAHENGIVHRDVKPGNLIVKPTGAVILVDFGVARSNAMTSVTGLNAIVGTALYMAPEQVAKGNLTPATDIYALGAVAYHCIAGRPPFDGDNALQVALRHLEDEPDPLPDHVPYEVRDLIARAMAKQPADRFQSASEFAEAAFAAAGPLDWKRLTGTSLVAPVSPARLGTGQFPTTPMSPAPMNAPHLSQSRMTAPVSPAAPRPYSVPQQSRPVSSGSRNQATGQRVLMFAILALFAVAGGLGLIFALTDRDQTPTSNPGQQAEVQQETPAPAVSDEFEELETSSTPSERISRRPNQPRPQDDEDEPDRTSSSPTPSDSPDATEPTTTPPTTEPTTTPPTTEPTTTPPTTEPTDPVEPGTGGGA